MICKIVWQSAGLILYILSLAFDTFASFVFHSPVVYSLAFYILALVF